MSTVVRKIIILGSFLILTASVYAEDKRGGLSSQRFESPLEMEILENASTKPLSGERIGSFLNFINKKAYASTINSEKKEREERKLLRGQWKGMLGMDIFYPYFKVKEVEDWVSEKASIQFFNLKGKPKLENDEVLYVFKIKL